MKKYIIRRGIFLLALLGAATATARQDIPLGSSGWALWLDRTATWKTDDLHVPPVAIGTLPVHAPTGGWPALFSQVVPESQAAQVVGTATSNSALSLAVQVPGTVEQFLWNALSGSNNGKGQSGNYVGVSWWGKDFSVPPLTAGQRVKLVFTEGVRQRAEVFVNQQLTGYEMVHQTPFEVDITAAVQSGAVNKLAVRITDPGGNFSWGDNGAQIWGTNGTVAAPSGYLYPMSHGFGGILGAVHLRIVTPVHVNDVFVKNKPSLRDIDVDMEIANNGGQAATGTINVAIKEAWKNNAAVSSPQTVYSATVGAYSVPANGTTKVSTSASVPAALLWGIRDANLYHFEVTVKDSGGAVIDQYVQRFGFRFLSVENYGTNTQLFLNGERTFILSAISWGFWPGNGIFPTPELAQKHITSAQTLGQNMLNFHRCEGNALVLNAADELGMLIYEEPGGYSSGQIPAADPLRQTVENFTVNEQLTSQRVLRMVKRDRSHPSLVQYNMINEPGTLPTQLTKDDMAAMHLADPTRLITYGSGGMSPAVAQPQKLHMLPYDQTQRTVGFCDVHNASRSPGVYVDSMYNSASSFWRNDKNPTEIFVWGEEGAVASPPQVELIQGDIAAAGRQGWDGADYTEWYDAYSNYISSKGLSSYYPSITGLITSLGNIGYYEHGRLIENVRIADDADIYILNGYEDMKLDNLSGIVDVYRNLKGDPNLLSKYMKPLMMSVKARGKIGQVGETNLADFYVLNEHAVPAGSYAVTITVEKPNGSTQTLLATNAVVSGGNKMSDLVAQGVSVPLNGGAGYYRVKATLTAAGQTVVGQDEILAVDWQSDQISGKGAVISGDAQLYNFIHDVKAADVVPYTSSLGPLDYLVVGAIDQGTTFNTIPSANFRALDGTTTGLNVDLYQGSAGTAFTTLVDQRVSAAPLDFDSSSRFIPGWDLVGPVNFSARMQGTITSNYTGATQFQVVHDDGVRVWVNGVQVLNSWTNTPVKTDTFSVDMVAGQAYTIKVEAYQAGSEWRFNLQWKLPAPPITVDYAGLLNRVAQDGTKLILLDRAESWLTALAGAASGGNSIPTYSVFRPAKTWVGSNMFVRDHPFFKDLPVNRGMSWEYQSLVVYDGPTHFGLYNMSGEEPVVSLVGGASHLVSTSVGIIPYGAGKIVFSSLDLVNNLALTTKASNVPKKILCNYLKWASGVIAEKLNPAGWLFTASISSVTAQNAGDGSMSTRWTSGASAASNQWFQVDLGAPQTFSEITMEQGTSANDIPAGYQVYVSDNGIAWGTAVASGPGTYGMTTSVFAQQTARYIRVVRTGTVGTYWSIHEFQVRGHPVTVSPVNRSSWVLSASVSAGANPPALAADNNVGTRWATGTPQVNGQWFQIDMGSVTSVGQLLLDSGAGSNDYPRGYQVKVSNDGSNWGNVVMSGTGAVGVNTINLAPQTVRFVRIYQTGAAAGNWWSINEVAAVGTPMQALNRTGWVGTASVSGSGAAAANVLDGNTGTRWNTGVGQTAGQWFKVDMGSPRIFSQIVLDAAAANNDYLRGYNVEVSNDNSAWSLVATGTPSSTITTISFPQQSARYLRITQTGSTGYFWSIAELNVYDPAAAPSVPTGLATSGGNGQMLLGWNAVSGATSYTVKRATSSGGPYTEVATNVTSTSFTDTGLSNGATYYYMISATNLAGTSADSGSSVGTAAPLPSPWQTSDIGSVGVVGNAYYVSPAYTLLGSGSDIYNAADAFRYVSQSSSGDCSVVARVTSQQNTNSWAKAGVMIRETTAAGAVNAAVVVNNGGISFQWRSTTGGATITTGGGMLTFPNIWVRLTRIGNSISAYKSADGTTWTQVGATQTIAMAGSATIGLAVTSHANTAISTVNFENVTATP